ncbi:MAG: fibro-slime domain-containing protein [Verrucomicrobia bacterium]|nr:fibro-slime domain-containing protein [Leptolyngbya sp. ES-bin-22]
MADIITLQGTIRDFSPTQDKDFQADFDSAVAVEAGIVGPELDSNHKPIYVGGNEHIYINGNAHRVEPKSTHGPIEFAKWYADNHPATAQKPLSITLTKIGTNPDIYSYANAAFFPIDGELLDQGVPQDQLVYKDLNGNPHNFHFTYELSTNFTYQGGERFTFTGDDDLWVFIDEKLVIDLGGIHPQQSATAILDDLTWVKYDPDGKPKQDKIKLAVGKSYSLRLFFAERHTTDSNFRIDTSIVLTQPVATIAASDPNANELGLDTGEFTISLDKAALTDLTVKYSVAGTATEGADYQPLTQSVLIPAGQTIAKILVTPIADQLPEGAETVIVTLIGGNGYQTGTPSSATVTILDNPPPFAAIAATDPQARESGLDPGQFTITLDKAAIAAVTIGYTVAGSATEGADYQPIGRSVLIPKGQTSAIIPVNPIADQFIEGDETVVVTLQPGSGYQLSPNISATVTIIDAPVVIPPVVPVATLVASDPKARKFLAGQTVSDPGEFTISLDQSAPTDNMVVNFSVGGTAKEGQDCLPMPRSAIFAKGQSQARVPVVPMQFSPLRAAAGDTTVVATLQPSVGCQLGAKITDTVTIIAKVIAEGP